MTDPASPRTGRRHPRPCRRGLAGPLALLVGVVAACSGGDDATGASTTSTTPATAEATAAAPIEERDDLLRELRTTDLAVAVDVDERVVVTVSNRGPNPAPATVLGIRTPGTTAATDDERCETSGGDARCHLGELLARETTTVRVTIRAGTTATVSVSHDGPETAPGDNTETFATPTGGG